MVRMGYFECSSNQKNKKDVSSLLSCGLPPIGSTIWITQPRTKTPYVATVLKHHQCIEEEEEIGTTEIQWSICGRKEIINLHDCQVEIVTSRRERGKKLKKTKNIQNHHSNKKRKQQQQDETLSSSKKNRQHDNLHLQTNVALPPPTNKVEITNTTQLCSNDDISQNNKSKRKEIKRKDDLFDISNNSNNNNDDDDDDDPLERKGCVMTSQSHGESNQELDNSSIFPKEQTNQSCTNNNYNISTNNHHNPKNFPDKIDFYFHSAYLQHLAEMCFMISYDVRWKIDNKQIFHWENGDDLNAIYALAKLYKHNFIFSENINNNNNEKENDTFEEFHHQRKLIRSSARAMHLYSRMFHRKGPWFTLDDLFFRYYHYYDQLQKISKQKSTRHNQNKDLKNVEMKGSEEEEISHHSPTTIKENADNNDKYDNDDVSILYGSLDSMHQPLFDFFSDIQKLLSCGLIRTFESEQECGMVVGNVDYGSGRRTLLTSNERDSILQKIGGSSPRKNKNKQKKRVLENAIWKQMRTQKSIFSSSCSSSSEFNIHLPVRHHVNNLLLKKIANRLSSLLIGRSSISNDDICKFVRNTWGETCSEKESIHRGGQKPLQNLSMCISLREQPLQTLRRAIRLFLCATSGPGNIRSDLYSGWNLPVNDSFLVSKEVVCAERKRQWEEEEEVNKRNFWGKFTSPQMPNSSTWGDTVYRSLHSMLGLIHCEYREQFKPLLSYQDKDHDILKHQRLVEIFSQKSDFWRWEVSAEIRLVVDHLIEWNESVLYIQRKNMREENKKLQQKGSNIHDGFSEESLPGDCDCQTSLPLPSVNDVLHLKSVEGRKLVVQRLMGYSSTNLVQKDCFHNFFRGTEVIVQNVESEISSIGIFGTNMTKHRNGHGAHIDAETVYYDDGTKHKALKTDAEKMLCVVAIICHQVLIFNLRSSKQKDMSLLIHRPWLRHLAWQSILANIIWDCIPFIEKGGFYELASFMLHTILLGPPLQSISIDYSFDICQARTLDTQMTPTERVCSNQNFESINVETFVQVLLSRRTRGKAFDRLTIDLKHVSKIFKVKEIHRGEVLQSKVTKQPKKEEAPTYGKMIGIEQIYMKIHDTTVPQSSIPFSSVRKLTRRMEKALKCSSLDIVSNEETEQLQLRILNTNDENMDDSTKKSWSPLTDKSIANAIVNENKSSVGKRCSFMGNEVETETLDLGSIRSLNVEELALEEYNAGNLPKEDIQESKGIKGGWVGWHDEGGHVRVLFRIFLSSVLGNDEAEQCFDDPKLNHEQYTIFLTPYQSAPHDLHVGHASKIRSFYERRQHTLQDLCQKLEKMTPQEISDFVYQSVCSRKYIADKSTKTTTDKLLENDIHELRTLSMIAAGFGGKMLSQIFRALCFDYRHYSGGLPDLLLVRAFSQHSEEEKKFQMVDLGVWVGEAFVEGNTKMNRGFGLAKSIVYGDDEFLGCNPEELRGKKQKQHFYSKNIGMSHDVEKQSCDLPPRLLLTFENRSVTVECMFVEVKSSNDRLDERQLDWLNLLDLKGNARVCKFETSSKRKKSLAKDLSGMENS